VGVGEGVENQENGFQKALGAPGNEAVQLSFLPTQATALLLKNLKPFFTPCATLFSAGLSCWLEVRPLA
jgi:hypothetical protein